MIWTILVFVTLAGTLLYYYYLYLAWRGYARKQPGLISGQNKVSVVVAARNEAENITELLTRLINQTYDKEKIEVIIADDGSTDGTGAIVERFSRNNENIRLHAVQRKTGKVSSKKNALQQAVELAVGEMILITDADCCPGTNWVKTMVSSFEPDTDMVAGLSRTQGKNIIKPGSVQWFEHFDFLAMFAVAGGLIRSGKYFSCSAQNLAYRKKSWEQVNGYQEIMHLESGDDVNLMQLFRRSGGRIRFCTAGGSMMTTRATDSWSSLINQRSRWASNTGFQVFLNPEFFVYLVSVLIITFFPWLLLFYSWKTALGLLIFRIIIEMNFVRKVFAIFRAEPGVWLGYPLWMVMQPVYMLIVALRGIFSLYEWKK
jgi:cellulose synthase/poly-beta-1,6-N-acetylglucosamine synthase-like glycosyltransferase